MKTNTPRTDAVIQSPNSFFMVRVENLCRELERELAASKAEVERLKQKVAEQDHLVRTCNLLAKEEERIMQRWKDWGITKELQLKKAVEIAETSCKYLNSGGWNEDELYSGKGGWVTETEIDEVCATLAALKGELK